MEDITGDYAAGAATSDAGGEDGGAGTVEDDGDMISDDDM